MGFMDKAKKLAEQAQQKLDESQQNFNKGQAPQGGPAQGGVQYDEHGRPIQQPPAAADVPAPDPAAPAAPSGDTPAGEPPAPTPPEPPTAEEPTPPPPPAARGGDANASPDPFKPLQQ